MKITLISTNLATSEIGLRIISSLLKQNGHETNMIFLPTIRNSYTSEVLDSVKKAVSESDLIAVTAVSNSFTRTRQLLTALRELNIPIVMGGIHATLNPEECLTYADFVCIGEGEHAILELVNSIEKGMDANNIRNIWTKRGNQVISNPVRPLLSDLDSLPFQDYDIEQHKVLENEELVQFEERHLGYWELITCTHNLKGSVGFLLKTMRGCPRACKYCCNYEMKKIYSNELSSIRKRSIGNVIEELSAIKKRFPSMSVIWFNDDNLIVRTNSEIEEFAKRYSEEIDLPFIFEADPVTITDQRISILAKSCRFTVKMGIQSGSEFINSDIFNRHITNDRVLKTTSALNPYLRRGNNAEFQFITTNPYESEEDILKTVSLIKDIPPPFLLSIHNLVFFPGTELYRMAKNDGLICCGKESHEFQIQDFKDNISSKNIQNRYLYSLVNFMTGPVRGGWIGYVPRALTGPLTWRTTIFFNNKTGIMTRMFDILNMVRNKRYYGKLKTTMKKSGLHASN